VKIGSVASDFSAMTFYSKKPEIFPDVYDAIYQVMTKEFAGVPGRKAVILLTDGFIVGRTVTAQVFDDTIIEGDTVIYPVMFLTKYHLARGKSTITYEELYKQNVTVALDNMAVKTGGRLLVAGKDLDFKSAFQSVGDELKKQYILGFYPSNYDSKKPGRIALSVNTPEMKIRSKRFIRVKPTEGPK